MNYLRQGANMSEQLPYEYRNLPVDKDELKCDPDPQVWSNWNGAVLLRDEIKRYCDSPIKLIRPFDAEYLKPASYHLRLGDECRVDGEDVILSDKSKYLLIPPHGIAIVRTFEWLNIPGFLIARWNLKVKEVYKGLVWVGSLQVDPGYQGFLFCPLYNLSTKSIELRYKDTLFTIDFVKTTIFDESKGCELWKARDSRPTYSLAYLDTQRLQSAPEETDKKAEEAKNTVKVLGNIVIISLTIIVTAIAVLATMNTLEPIKVPSDWTNVGPAWLTIVALVLSILALYYSLIRRKK